MKYSNQGMRTGLLISEACHQMWSGTILFKCMNSVLSKFIESTMPLDAYSKLCKDLAWVGVFVRSARSSA